MACLSGGWQTHFAESTMQKIGSSLFSVEYRSERESSVGAAYKWINNLARTMAKIQRTPDLCRPYWAWRIWGANFYKHGAPSGGAGSRCYPAENSEEPENCVNPRAACGVNYCCSVGIFGLRSACWAMLTIYGNKSRFCDGISRRNFLKVGALGLGGLALPQLLAAESQMGIRRSHKAVIMIFLPGGPSHQDIFDLKMDAPREIRGDFKPISTKVPGIQICEHLPRLAKMMDKLVLIRSMVGALDDHNAFQCLTGRTARNQPPGGWPCMGSVLSKLYGAAVKSIPPFVGLAPKMGHMEWADNGMPGFLGVGHAPFQPNKGGGKDDMSLNGVTLDRLADRKRLLASFDRFRRDIDASGMMEGLDAFNEQAFGILTSSKLLEALDLEKEDKQIRERYGKGDPKNRDDGGPKLMDHFLIARRLVEAGARCVTLAFSRWDH